MTTYSRILAWIIPCTEEPGGLKLKPLSPGPILPPSPKHHLLCTSLPTLSSFLPHWNLLLTPLLAFSSLSKLKSLNQGQMFPQRKSREVWAIWGLGCHTVEWRVGEVTSIQWVEVRGGAEPPGCTGRPRHQPILSPNLAYLIGALNYPTPSSPVALPSIALFPACVVSSHLWECRFLHCCVLKSHWHDSLHLKHWFMKALPC